MKTKRYFFFLRSFDGNRIMPYTKLVVSIFLTFITIKVDRPYSAVVNFSLRNKRLSNIGRAALGNAGPPKTLQKGCFACGVNFKGVLRVGLILNGNLCGLSTETTRSREARFQQTYVFIVRTIACESIQFFAALVFTLLTRAMRKTTDICCVNHVTHYMHRKIDHRLTAFSRLNAGPRLNAGLV